MSTTFRVVAISGTVKTVLAKRVSYTRAEVIKAVAVCNREVIVRIIPN